MIVLAHISDLHFGAVNPGAAEGLRRCLQNLAPDALIISGDLTQRARRHQYAAAAAYLSSLPGPQLVVPGNHDVPLFDVFTRFLAPLSNYTRFISADHDPFLMLDGIGIQGINTARSLTWKNGRVSAEQMAAITQRMCALQDEHVKILVTHHPFLGPPGAAGKHRVGRAAQTLAALEQCRLDLLLAGHLHMSYTGDTHAVYTSLNRTLLVFQAGTAISGRTRNERNAFNVLRVGDRSVRLTVFMWNGDRFTPDKTRTFHRRGRHWVSADPDPASLL